MGGHSTHVVVIPPHPDVSLLPPGGAPAVLDQPVVLVGVGVSPVPHHQRRVVHVPVTVAALGLVVNPGFVELEAVLAGVNSDGNWANVGHSRLELPLVPLLDDSQAVLSGAHVAVLELAATAVPGCVGVALLCVNTISILKVLEGLFRVASITTLKCFSSFLKYPL